MEQWILIEAGHPHTTKDVPVTSLISRDLILTHENKVLAQRRAKLMNQLTHGELNLRLQADRRKATKSRFKSLRRLLRKSLQRAS